MADQIKPQDKKTLVGVKMTLFQKAAIKARSTMQSIDMQTVYDEMVGDYFTKKPITKEETAMANTIVEAAITKKEEI